SQSSPVILPPLHYQGLDAAQPFGYQPPAQPAIPPPGMHPSRLAALAGPPQSGVVRSAEEMEGVEEQPAKRQKVAKLPGGQYYPEADWINMHPVSHLLYLALSLHRSNHSCRTVSNFIAGTASQ